jgi:hypothetical protein
MIPLVPKDGFPPHFPRGSGTPISHAQVGQVSLCLNQRPQKNLRPDAHEQTSSQYCVGHLIQNLLPGTEIRDSHVACNFLKWLERSQGRELWILPGE